MLLGIQKNFSVCSFAPLLCVHIVFKIYFAREGVIIKCPLNGQYHDARDVILTSRNDVRGFPSDDDDDEMSLFTLKRS